MENFGYTGKGIGVCILDTGIYDHIDFAGRIWVFRDFISSRRFPYDDNGHGTHVAGLIAGDGTASMGKYRGAAPGCGIVALKVLDRYGNGSESDVMRALQWLEEHWRRYGIRILNISVGTTSNSGNDHTRLVKGVERLWDAGLVVVTAAGNQGPKPGSVTAPGNSKKVITVGSSDLLNGRSAISGRGPTEECVCKPDLVAPGNRIVSCVPGKPYSYGIKSGTSMSTPLVTGAIACALEKDPTLTNRDIKTMLKESTDDLGFSRNQQGWGKFNRRKFLDF